MLTSGTLTPGTLIDRYELLAPIGEGGMAQVWAARQKGKHGFEKLFALKCITPRFAEEPAFRNMFLDEARIAASIEHPNVAQVYDLGESGAVLYLVMEYVDGESLGSLMTSISRQTQKEAVVHPAIALRIIGDVCAGLHAAHKLQDENGNLVGVVHRDISPQNILLSVRGDVKVIDFGIALAKDRITGDTNDGSLKGKLHYMPAEQAMRREVGPYSDVFSTGATLYRMLAGRPPFDGGNDAATLQLLVSGAAPTPLPENIPPLVAAITERALAADPGDRYASALAMQTAIEAAIVEEGYVADVASWVNQNLSERTRERRRALTTITSRALGIGTKSDSAVASASLASPGPAPAMVDSLPIPSPPELGSLPNPALRAAAADARRPPAGIGASFDIYTTSDLESAVISPIAPPRDVAPIGLAETTNLKQNTLQSAASTAPPPSQDPPASSEPEPEPGVMDVRALLARASASPGPGLSPAQPPPPARVVYEAKNVDPFATDDESAREEPKIELAVARHEETKKKRGTSNAAWMRLGLAGIAIVFFVSLVLLLLPRVIQDRVVSSAREAGIELTIERVGVGIGGVALKNVTARFVRIPNVELTAEEIYAAGATAKEVRVRGLDAKLDGNVQTLAPQLLDFYASNQKRLAGSSSDPRRVTVVGARITWKDFAGEGSRLAASDAGLELTSGAVGAEDVRASVGRFEITTHRTTFGPWGASFERNIATARLRLLFDPPVPDGPSALFVQGAGVAPKLTVRIPRSPIARLGLRPDQLEIPADPNTELEAKLEVGQVPSMRIEASGRIDLWGARLKGVKQPVDMKIEGMASGLPGKPMDFEKTSVTIGPFVAIVTGAITPTDPGFRLDASWRTVPIPCEKLAKAEAKNMGPMAVAIQEIAASTGIARVTGTAVATGIAKYDTKNPDDASLTFTTRDTCGLTIFGR